MPTNRSSISFIPVDVLRQAQMKLCYVPDGYSPILVPNIPFSELTLMNGESPAIANCVLKDRRLHLVLSALYSYERTVKRPPNAFILYRQHKQYELSTTSAKIDNNELSVKIGTMWKNEPLEVRAKWKAKAMQMKLDHQLRYPNYKYNPRPHRGSKQKSSSEKASESQQVDLTEVVRIPNMETFESHNQSSQTITDNGQIDIIDIVTNQSLYLKE